MQSTQEVMSLVLGSGAKIGIRLLLVVLVDWISYKVRLLLLTLANWNSCRMAADGMCRMLSCVNSWNWFSCGNFGEVLE